MAHDPYPAWGLTERMAILAAVEYRHLDSDPEPPNLVSLVGFAAGHAALSVPPARCDSTPLPADAAHHRRERA